MPKKRKDEEPASTPEVKHPFDETFIPWVFFFCKTGEIEPEKCEQVRENIRSLPGVTQVEFYVGKKPNLFICARFKQGGEAAQLMLKLMSNRSYGITEIESRVGVGEPIIVNWGLGSDTTGK
jgi:hypothetical protein